jgi:hypothetical protein
LHDEVGILGCPRTASQADRKTTDQGVVNLPPVEDDGESPHHLHKIRLSHGVP